MRLVICLDSFKGSLSSIDAGKAIARGWHRVRPKDTLEVIGFADGGEGSLAAISLANPNAKLRYFQHPLAGEVHWLELPESSVVELAGLCGLAILGTDDPFGASSYRVGLAIAAAIASGSKNIFVAIGGSASTDGGSGMLQALGAKLLDKAGKQIALGNGGLAAIASVEIDNILPADVSLTVLSDVTNPLLGANGSAMIYSTQKGASRTDIPVLEDNLRHFASFFDLDPETKGAGAAGGVGYGLMLLGAKMKSGAEYFAEFLDLRNKIAAADLIITGEGSFDSQSQSGKAVSIISGLAAERDCILVCGQIAIAAHGFKDTLALTDMSLDVSDAIANAAHYLESAGFELASRQLP